MYTVENAVSDEGTVDEPRDGSYVFLSFFLSFLILLCTAAQQSYRHGQDGLSSIHHRPSLDIVFSETVKWLDTKFG